MKLLFYFFVAIVALVVALIVLNNYELVEITPQGKQIVKDSLDNGLEGIQETLAGWLAKLSDLVKPAKE